MNWLPTNIDPNIPGFTQRVEDLPKNEIVEHGHRYYAANRLAVEDTLQDRYPSLHPNAEACVRAIQRPDWPIHVSIVQKQ